MKHLFDKTDRIEGNESNLYENDKEDGPTENGNKPICNQTEKEDQTMANSKRFKKKGKIISI